jgi:hypothetical protein
MHSHSDSHDDKPCCNGWRGWPVALAAIGACLIFAVLVWVTKQYTQPSAAADQARKAERAKALADVRAADTDAINNVGWVDQPRGVVRLPVEDAMKLAEREWRNPSQARSNLVARVVKATAPLPEAPNPFE